MFGFNSKTIRDVFSDELWAISAAEMTELRGGLARMIGHTDDVWSPRAWQSWFADAVGVPHWANSAVATTYILVHFDVRAC